MFPDETDESRSVTALTMHTNVSSFLDWCQFIMKFSSFCCTYICSSSSIPISSDGDHPDSEIGVSVNADDLKRQEEELRRKIELEAEERKLEETLEYQRRIEDEAKQKHLAEQLKKANQTYLEKVTEELDDLRLESGPIDLSVHEQLKPSIQVFIYLVVTFLFYCSHSFKKKIKFHEELECYVYSWRGSFEENLVLSNLVAVGV